jgi:hypothetical protein
MNPVVYNAAKRAFLLPSCQDMNIGYSDCGKLLQCLNSHNPQLFRPSLQVLGRRTTFCAVSRISPGAGKKVYKYGLLKAGFVNCVELAYKTFVLITLCILLFKERGVRHVRVSGEVHIGIRL